MANLQDAVTAFLTRDTQEQDEILRRVGIDTVVADQCLGALRGMAPDRYDALVAFGGVLS